MITKFKLFESIDGYEIVDVKDMINVTDGDIYMIDRKLLNIFVGKTCKFIGWRHDDNIYDEKEISGEVRRAWFTYDDEPEIDGEIIFTVLNTDFNVIRKNVYILVDPKKLQKSDDDPYNEEDWNENKADDFRKIYGEKISVIY